MTKIILASSSPRRLELLKTAGFDLEVVKPDCEENVPDGLTPEETVRFLAELKGKTVLNSGNYEDLPVVAADTVVVLENQVIGKPKDRADAEKILSELSGKTHQVYTGVAIFFKGKKSVFSVRSDVTFKNLSAREISSYCDTPEPYDKAGAYAAQGMSAFMVRRINGSFANVVGLPVCEVVEQFQELGILEK
jgi:MAF protein